MSRTLKTGLILLCFLLAAWVVVENIRASIRFQTAASRTSFTATDLEGKSWSLADYRGKQPVLVSFFATWCGPCRQELPGLVELQQRFGERGLRVVMITDEPADAVKHDAQLSHAPLTFLVNAAPVFRSYNITGIPHVVLFDRAGKVAAETDGYTPEGAAELEQHVKAVCAAVPVPSRVAAAR